MLKHILTVLILLNFFHFVSAQKSEAKDYIISGNQSYLQGDFAKAEAKYKTALSEDSNSLKANYNLGNALYQQKRLDESRVHYDRVIQDRNATKLDKHKAYHNIGKTYLDENDPEKAVASLKEALKLNPYDDETRYNYALARKLLEKQQEEKENQDQQNQDKEGNSDENQEDSQENSDQKEGGEEKNDGEQNPQNQSGNQQGGENGEEKGEGDTPQGQQITKGSQGEGAESQRPMNTERQEGLLEALRKQEQETLKKIISQKAQKQRVNTEKDW